MRTFNQAIRDQLELSMKDDPSIVLLGLGVDDPKRFFGTTNSLVEIFGNSRVIECPTAENGYVGHALGLALGGYLPVVHFQRMDFMLYAFDQLVNNVAKWSSMFPGHPPFSYVIRTLVGNGWGQGAQHSQNLAPLLAQVPGLKVVTPSCPNSAAALLEQSLKAEVPTVIVEHRWLQFLKQSPSADSFTLGKAMLRTEGSDLSIVTWSYGVAEILRLKQLFPNQSWDVVDLLSLNPLDVDLVARSFRKTKKLFVWEPGWSFGGIGAEIIASVSGLPGKAVRRGYPMSYPPSSHRKVQEFYPGIVDLVQALNENFGLQLALSDADVSRWPVDQDNSLWNPWN